MGDIWKAACENEIRLPCQKESAKKSVLLLFNISSTGIEKQ